MHQTTSALLEDLVRLRKTLCIDYAKNLFLGATETSYSYTDNFKGRDGGHFTDQEVIPAKNAIDAHVHGFLVNGELLLPNLKAFATCTQYTPLEMLDVFSLGIAENSVAPANNSKAVPRTAPDTPHKRSFRRLRSVGSIANRLRDERSSARISKKAFCLLDNVQTTCGAQPASYSTETEFLARGILFIAYFRLAPRLKKVNLCVCSL